MAQLGVNRITLIGNLGQDPKLNHTENNRAVCNFSLAVNEQYHSGDEKIERTEWFRIVTFNALAEVCHQYLTKGRVVYIVGRVQTRRYEDRDGVERSVTEVVANVMKMLDRAKKGNGPNSGLSDNQPERATIDSDDTPF